MLGRPNMGTVYEWISEKMKKINEILEELHWI